MGRRTPNDHITLAPLEVTEDRVQRVGRIGDEDHFVKLGPNELRDGLPKR